jgi:predicted component of type VI protein secretion system
LAPVENVVDTFVPQQTFSIGRSPECDLVLADQSVSRKHAELLVLDDGQLFLVDCQSTHGTRVSQHGQTRQVHQEFVSIDAIVEFGDVSMPVGDIVDALREKHPEAKLPKPSQAAAAAAGLGAGGGPAWPQGTRLVRCRCGVIKVRGQRCSECGE